MTPAPTHLDRAVADVSEAYAVWRSDLNDKRSLAAVLRTDFLAAVDAVLAEAPGGRQAPVVIDDAMVERAARTLYYARFVRLHGLVEWSDLSETVRQLFRDDQRAVLTEALGAATTTPAAPPHPDPSAVVAALREEVARWSPTPPARAANWLTNARRALANYDAQFAGAQDSTQAEDKAPAAPAGDLAAKLEALTEVFVGPDVIAAFRALADHHRRVQAAARVIAHDGKWAPELRALASALTGDWA